MKSATLVSAALQLVVICSLIVKILAAQELQKTQHDPQIQRPTENANSTPVQGQDVWFISLGWNLIGYATIIIPAAFLIRMVKNSSFNEKEGI